MSGCGPVPLCLFDDSNEDGDTLLHQVSLAAHLTAAMSTAAAAAGEAAASCIAPAPSDAAYSGSMPAM